MITQDHYNRLVAKGRDEMLTAFCAIARPNEAQQRDAARRFVTFMETLVEEVVGVVAIGEFRAFGVKLENIDGKGKIALKAQDVDEAGPALITRLGASLTLVVTDVEQFDRDRPDPTIELDQRPLPLETVEAEDDDEGEDFAEEAAEIAEEVEAPTIEADGTLNLSDLEPEPAVGPFFSAVETGVVRDGTGAEVAVWVLLHNDVEVFDPLAAGPEVQALADALNLRAAHLRRDLTPFEVRDGVLGMSTNTFGPALTGAYTTEAIQDSSKPANDEPAAKRGPKTRAEKVEAYFAGYDGAAADLFADDCPHDRGSLREEWLAGLQDAKAGKSPRWSRPGQIAANDDGESSSSEAAA